MGKSTSGGAFDVVFPLGGYLVSPPAGRTVREPARDVPVLAECDVAVLGGGPAGLCAAAAAARAGRSVVLVERHGMLGGMATAGGVTVLHSLYGTDGATKVIGGLAEEFIRRLQAAGAARNAAPDGETASWTICPETARFVCDDMAVGSGVKLLLHTRFAGVIRDGRRISAALVEGKSGRAAIVAGAFIDCTGDADLVRRAGGPTQLGDGHGRCQPPSLVFRVGGRKPEAAGLGQIQAELFRRTMDYNGGAYPAFLWGTPGLHDPAEHMMAGTRVVGINAADTLDMTRAEVEARYQLRWVLAAIRSVPGWQDSWLVAMAAQVGTRESHRIVAAHQLTRREVLEGAAWPDTIAQGTYPIDIHNPDGPGITFEYLDGTRREIRGDRTEETGRWDGRPAGAPLRETLCYSIPYRSLLPEGLENVLVAGRCAGANHDSAGAVRVMINCMQLGQAAGTAAAMMSPSGRASDVDVPSLRGELIRAGMPLRDA
ncbi:MAG TPA: FAD-dependent oxidoreductase [Phycisphaerae bacterium]|nr:FAD-dependent oxidoreductase [Phycisphaerae bacterium]